MRHAVNSDMAHALEFDPRTGTITVHFHSGGSDDFGPFTEAEYEAFRTAPSVGRHFHAFIKRRALARG